MIERIKLRLKGEGGVTIVEMLTVMIIMSIVFAGITSVFVAGSKAAGRTRTAASRPRWRPGWRSTRSAATSIAPTTSRRLRRMP